MKKVGILSFMKLHKYLLFLIGLVFLSAAYSCSKAIRIASIPYQPKPLSIVEYQGWPDSTAFDENSQLHYWVSNDSENLYLMLHTNERTNILRMLRAGMEVQIDTLGGNAAHCIIRFPMEEARITLFDGVPILRARMGAPTRSENQQRPDPVAMFNSYMIHQTHMALTGFKNHKNGRLPVDGETGILVSLNTDTAGVVSYRAVIPLDTFYKTLVPGQPSASRFTLTVKINGVEMPATTPLFAPGGSTGQQTMPPIGSPVNQPQHVRRPAIGPQPSGEMQELQRSRILRFGFSLTAKPVP